MSSLGIQNDLFNQATQEKIGDYFLLTQKPSTAAYLKGTNKGTKDQLSNAVQAIAQEWAALPAIKLENKTVVGWVDTGGGNNSYYGNVGPNHSITKIKVADVVQALIKSRIQYTGVDSPTLYKPSYYKP